MYTLVIVLAAFIGIQAVSFQALVQEQWELFKIKHDKIYLSDTEEQYRQGIFMENVHKINEHNKLYEMGLSSYKMDMNHFGDLSKEEFLRMYTVKLPELPQLENSTVDPWSIFIDTLPQSMQDFYVRPPPVNSEDVPDLPGDIDWRARGCVTPVKNQGKCGSCWSFSATGALEAQWRLHKSNNLVPLSEQNLVDCSWKYGNHGCRGGWMHWAFRYIKENGGIDSAYSYDYTGRSGKCRYSASKRAATVSQVVLIPQGEQQLEIKVGTTGPISIAAEVSHNFQFYSRGVYNEPNCGRSLNHAMLVVGYGSEGGNQYWLVKNSWGTEWGDQGYIRMSRNRSNQCGIALMASYPIV